VQANAFGRTRGSKSRTMGDLAGRTSATSEPSTFTSASATAEESRPITTILGLLARVDG
jgi:hypothetical protein